MKTHMPEIKLPSLNSRNPFSTILNHDDRNMSTFIRILSSPGSTVYQKFHGFMHQKCLEVGWTENGTPSQLVEALYKSGWRKRGWGQLSRKVNRAYHIKARYFWNILEKWNVGSSVTNRLHVLCHHWLLGSCNWRLLSRVLRLHVPSGGKSTMID